MLDILSSLSAPIVGVDTWNPYPIEEYVKPDFAASYLDSDRALSLPQYLIVVEPTVI